MGDRSHRLKPISIGLLFAGVLVLYNANLRQVSSGDTYASRFVPISMLRDGDVALDEFFSDLFGPRADEILATDYDTTLYRANGHLYDSHPPVGPLLAIPVYALPVWMHVPADDRTLANLVSKLAASLMTALSVLLVFGVVRRMLAHLRARPDDVGSTARAVTRHETRVALIAALAYGLGTPVWSTAAQAMWSHTPAVLGYALMLWALLANAPIIAGAAAAAAAVARPATAPAAAISMLYLAHRAWRHARRDGSRSTATRAAFMPALHGFFAAAVVGGLGLAYNLRIFGNAGGGAPIRAAPGLDDLGATGMFSGSILEGLAGLVISPRGILIFSPIVIVGIAAAAWAWTRRVSSPDTATERDEAVLLARYSSIAAAVTLLVYAKYVVWWGGHAFGPRYLTDVMPFVGLLMGLGLSRVLAADSLAPVAGTPTRRPGTIAALVVATLFVYSAAVQAIGAFCWPSAWTLDKNPPYRERLWDWRRNEIVECIRSGPRLDPMARRLLARLSGNLGE